MENEEGIAKTSPRDMSFFSCFHDLQSAEHWILIVAVNCFRHRSNIYLNAIYQGIINPSAPQLLPSFSKAVSVDDVGSADIIDLSSTSLPLALETTTLLPTVSTSDASMAPSDVRSVTPTMDTEQSESFSTSTDITTIDRIPLSPGMSMDTSLSSSGSSVLDTTDETPDGRVYYGNKAVSDSVLDSGICPVDGSTMGDDDDPADPGINDDDTCPSSASSSPVHHAPNDDEIAPSTKPGATTPSNSAATNGEGTAVIALNDITSTSETSPTVFDGVEHSREDPAHPDDILFDNTMEQCRGDANHVEDCVTTPAASESDDGSEPPAGIEDDGGSTQATGVGSDSGDRSTNFDRSNNSGRATDSESDGGDQSAEGSSAGYDETGGTSDEEHESAARGGSFDGAAKMDDKWLSGGGHSSGKSGAGDVPLASQDASEAASQEVSRVPLTWIFSITPYTSISLFMVGPFVFVLFAG